MVDKIYICSFSYDIDKKTNKPYRPVINAPESSEMSAYDNYINQSEKALRNKLLQNYLDLITDSKNLSNARASIDVLTDIMKHDIVSAIRIKSYETPISGYELIPSFQVSRKNEYTLGKKDLAIFALNTTSHAMTQLVHLNIIHNDIEKFFGFGNCSDIIGKDGYKISDWLSAMVSAHADVAKDPFIFTLNVNKVTATTTAYLLRSGMGASTFTFLAQPILKKYAARVTAQRGMYGVENKTVSIKKQVMSELKHEYMNKLSETVHTLLQMDPNAEIPSLYQRMLESGVDGYGSELKDAFINKNKDKELQIFNLDYAKSVINPVNAVNSESVSVLKQNMRHYAHQLITMYVYESIQPHVNILSSLVTQSRIDTKKFGNNITSQLNFINSYYDFKFDIEKNSEVNIPEQYRKVYMEDNMGLYEFFDGTFLHKKLAYATNTMRMLLSNESFTATKFYCDTFIAVMQELFGHNIKYEIGKDGSKKLHQLYRPVMNDDIVQTIGNIIDTIIRHKSLTYYFSVSDKNVAPDEIDFSLGEDDVKRAEKLRELIIGGKYGSVPKRLSTSKWYITSRYNQYREAGIEIPDYLNLLCNADGSIRNEFLNWINYKGGQIDSIVLSESQISVDESQKDKIIAAFQELLELTTTSTDPFDQGMVESIRNLAKDLILYSYYTTYNNNSANMFFDVVPVEYRNQYDSAISKMLHNYRIQKNKEYVEYILGGNQYGEGYNGAYFTELIIRNMWYRDEIISPFGDISPITSKGLTYNSKNEPVSANYNALFSDVQGVGIQIASQTPTDGNVLYPILAIPQYQTYGAEWIKIKDQFGSFQIYHRIGHMQFTSNKTSSKLQTKSVYQIVPKLGHVERGNIIPEWFTNSNGESIFDENKISIPIPTDEEINSQLGLNEKELSDFLSKKRVSKLYDASGKRLYDALEFVRDDQKLPPIDSGSNEMHDDAETSVNINTTSSVNSYSGNITFDTNTIFVFGSNPEGRHGAGAAKIAREQFGAQYGIGEGLTGNAYALPTKDLRVKENNGMKSISKDSIVNSIRKMYEVARSMPNKQFKVAYRNTDQISLNGYTGLEMIDMFIEAGPIPNNVVFSQEWINTGKFDNIDNADKNALPSDYVLHSVGNKTAEHGVIIDKDLIKNYKTWLQNNPNGIVAHRVNKKSFNTVQMVENGIIGNPFSWQKYGVVKSLTMFYNWIINGNNYNEPLATEEFRQAIISKLMATETPNILYDKELNTETHATILEYLIEHKELLPNKIEGNLFGPSSFEDNLTDEERAQGKQFKDFCKGE